MKKIQTKQQSKVAPFRVVVFRSLKHIVAQLVTQEGKTLATVTDNKLGKMPKIQRAKEVGIILAKKVLAAKGDRIVFDRRTYRFHGRVRAVADGLKEGGVKI